ncbi:MAG TPA: hypothetical protein VGH94_03365, partial [Acidimicrobiales bacterium]
WNCLDTTIPATKELNEALAVSHSNWLAGGKDFDIASGGCIAWGGGKEFAKAIANINPAPTATITSDDVIRGLSMFNKETLGGISPPLTFSDGTKPNPQVTCTFLYKWENLKLISVPGPDGLYTCNP